MKTHFDDGRVLDLEGLLYNMKSRIYAGDLLADTLLGRALTEREETMATLLMNLRDDWDRFEAAVLERESAGV